MKILHITSETNGYEEVELVANNFSKTNEFAVITRNGEEHMTGGFLITNTPQIRKILDSIPKEDQYKFVWLFKVDPFVKFYHSELL